MSSIGTGYDLAAGIFSPDGRIFQVEYAQKAVDNSGTALAVRGKDGVVFAVEKLIGSKLFISDANARVNNVDGHIGFASAGMYTDAQALLDYCREEAQYFLKEYREPIPIEQLSEQVASYVHAYTLGIHRPFGASGFLGTWNKSKGAQLLLVEPNGLCYEYRAWAIGKHRQAAKTEVEKLKLDEMSCSELVKEAARIIHTVRDEAKDKNFKLELGWIGELTNGKFQLVPSDIAKEAEEWAKKKLAEDDSDDETQ